MVNIINISTNKAAVIRKSTRVLFLFIGFSLIVMELISPPVKTLWITVGSLLGAVLVLFSIMGLSPRLKVSGFGMVVNNTTFQVVANVLIGMGLIIAAMINPPVYTAWYVYFNLIGILLVFDAIITSTLHPASQKDDDTKHLHPHV